MNPLKRFSVITLIFQFCFCLAVCRDSFGQYHFYNWTTDDGLPQNGLRAITQTPDGYLWFTTFDGLVRFDGVRFTTFNKSNTKGIINNRFTGLYGDKDGTLYATTKEDGTLTIYRNGVFSSLNSDQIPGHYIIRIKPDETGELRFLVEDDDRTSKSWYRLHDDKFTFIEKRGRDNEKIVYQGNSGAIWTVMPTEITELRNGQLTIYPLDLRKVVFDVKIFEDRDNNLWVGENRVHRLHNGAVETFDRKNGLPDNAIYHSFWQETDGSVWFASDGGERAGIGLIQYKNGQFTFRGREQGLADSSVFAVLNDREGTTWLATNKGLSRMRRKFISAYSTKDGINHPEVYPLYRDRADNIWIGTIEGLSIYRNGKFESLDLKPKSRNVPPNAVWRNGEMSVQSLWQDADGKMWIGLNGGIFIAENGVAEMLPDTEGYHVFAIKQDKSGDVWAATNKGLLQYRNYKLVRSYSTKDGLPNEFMTFIFESKKGELWFGGLGGLSEFRDGNFINYTTANGLAGNYLRTIYEDAEGTFWIGTYDEGLSRLKDGKFTNFKEENGLYSSGVFAIQEDAKGSFWISSNRGIYRVKHQELNDFADGKISRINSVGFGKKDGMLATECNGGRQPATVTDKDGHFWFPTQDGVIVVDSAAEIQNSMPPLVVIEEVLVERQPIDFRNGIIIEPGEKNIEIRYTGLSLIKSAQLKFQYKLEGHDADWIDAGTQRTVYYSYLPPGNYQFQVRAANSDGVWNESGATLGLELKPFFYQTKSFYLLCIAVGALCLFFVWQISVYQLKARERHLAKLVGDKTLELKKANIELEQLANSDGLTKIANRRHFERFLTNEWNRAVRSKTEISMILLDIDHFKLFNDTYGHQSGDECLQKVAAVLAKTLNRPTDLVARFGGEEFALVLGNTNAAGAFSIAGQIMENVKHLKIPHAASKTFEDLTISLGVATTIPTFEMNASDLIERADKALYRAKGNGRNQIYAFDFQPLKPSLLEDEFVINPLTDGSVEF